MSKRYLIVGATRGMGQEVARRLAERGDTLFLLGRSEPSLEASRADLVARGAADVQVRVFDLARTEDIPTALDAAEAALGRLDGVVVTAGLFGTQEQLEDDLDLLHRVLDVNFTRTVLLCEHARRRLLAAGGGTLVVFSSVAGDRGRKTVGLYGATKAGLSHYLESLDHRYRAEGLVTLCVKPGFVRTEMTAGLKEPPFAGEPEAVSREVVAAMGSGAPLIYTPKIWALVMMVIRRLPRFVMRRVGF